MYIVVVCNILIALMIIWIGLIEYEIKISTLWNELDFFTNIVYANNWNIEKYKNECIILFIHSRLNHFRKILKNKCPNPLSSTKIHYRPVTCYYHPCDNSTFFTASPIKQKMTYNYTAQPPDSRHAQRHTWNPLPRKPLIPPPPLSRPGAHLKGDIK